MRNIMEKMRSNRDVIVCRGIWYVMTLLSLFGLSISLNLLWPPRDSSSWSRFLRDGAVSVTTFYAVTLLRYLFFTDPPSTCYREFTRLKERIPQLVFSEVSMYLVIMSPLGYVMLNKKVPFRFVWYMSLFTISLFTGGIGLIQLSDKFRMEMRHALYTLVYGWLVGPIGIFEALYGQDYQNVAFLLSIFYYSFVAHIISIQFPEEEHLALPT